jgi:hypothetical protein
MILFNLNEIDIKTSDMQIVEQEGKLVLTNGFAIKSLGLLGVRVTPPTPEIANILDGFFYFDQKCIFHIQIIEHKSKGKLPLIWPNCNYSDGQFEGHYSVYRIVDNEIVPNPNGLSFYDAVSMKLHDKWTHLTYVVEFETYFNYSIGGVQNIDVRTCFSFKWGVSAKLRQNENGIWGIENSDYYPKNDESQQVKNHHNGPAPTIWKNYDLEKSVQNYWRKMDPYDIYG